MQSRLFTKKVVLLSLLLLFRRKCVKMGLQIEGGANPYFRCFFAFVLIGVPLGAPGLIFLDFWAPRASFWHLFGCPGHHFDTLGAHQKDL